MHAPSVKTFQCWPDGDGALYLWGGLYLITGGEDPLNGK